MVQPELSKWSTSVQDLMSVFINQMSSWFKISKKMLPYLNAELWLTNLTPTLSLGILLTFI